MIEPQLQCPAGVIYDDAAHTYVMDGAFVPSVSQILKVVNPDQYVGIREEVMERARTRGHNGHAMIALDARDDLDLSKLSDTLADQYCAWDAFRHDFGFDVEYSERVVCSRKYRFCGTLDLAGQLRKHKRRKGRWQVDIKMTAARPCLVDIQTAGYDLAAAECIEDWSLDTPRGCLWIHGDKYTFIECPNPGDRAVFLSARNIASWRENHGK